MTEDRALSLNRARQRLLAELRKRPPYVRCVDAELLIAECIQIVSELGELRSECVRDMRDQGLSYAEIATLIGVSQGRAREMHAGSRIRRRKARAAVLAMTKEDDES